MARAAVTRDRDRHDADRTRPRDQHILAYDVERQRRMRRIAERIEDRGDVVVDRVRQLEHVGGRQREVLGERTRMVDADPERIAAQVPPAGAAIAAMAAGDVTLARDAIADLEAAHFAAEFDDLARIFVPDGHGHRDGFLRPGIPVVDMHVGSADRGLPDLDEHIVVADCGLRDVL